MYDKSIKIQKEFYFPETVIARYLESFSKKMYIPKQTPPRNNAIKQMQTIQPVSFCARKSLPKKDRISIFRPSSSSEKTTRLPLLARICKKHPVLMALAGFVITTTGVQLLNNAQLQPDFPHSKRAENSFPFDAYRHLQTLLKNSPEDINSPKYDSVTAGYIILKNKILASDTTEDIVKNLRNLGEYLKDQKKITKMSDLDIYKTILLEISGLSGNNNDLFIEYLNRLFVGNSVNPFVEGNFGVKKYSNKPLVIGDEGYYDYYRDYTNYQSRHLSGFIISGYRSPPGWSSAGNFVHELVQSTGNRNDYYAGELGIKIGQMLKRGELTPSTLADNIDRYAGTEELFDKGWFKGTSLLSETSKPAIKFM